MVRFVRTEFLESVRVRRIELRLQPWEGRALPLRHTREKLFRSYPKSECCLSGVRINLLDEDFFGGSSNHLLPDCSSLEK
jgi:hypothetical protein